jgi:RHS repeat-associated protein
MDCDGLGDPVFATDPMVTPSYDGDGNLAFDGTFTYCYDAESRLTGVLSSGTRAGPGTAVATYAYDAQGRRKSKTVGATKTVFVTDADNREVLEYDGTSGQVQRWYTYGLGIDEPLNQMNVPPATRLTFIPDIQGSIIATLDSGSGALAKTGYLAYGENVANTSGTLRFTGRRLDGETGGSAAQPSGLYYYRTRTYSPTWGRFLQTDPIGYAGGANLYAYVNNDPLNLADPLGLDSQFGINISGTAALVILGANVGATFGISVPDRPWNIGGYQLFVTPQVAGMAGAGAYIGAGVSGAYSHTSGPLPLVSSAVNVYAEADIGKVAAAGVSVQSSGNVLSPGYDPSKESFGGTAVSLPVRGGAGLGLWGGAGLAGNVTVATPTVGQVVSAVGSAISPIFGGSTAPTAPAVPANPPTGAGK